MPATHQLDSSLVHYEWNNSLAPRLTIEPGDTVAFDTRDASDGYFTARSTAADAAARGPFRGHPLTGPVQVRGARPGDVLAIEIVEMKPAAPFGWTAIRPGRGLLPEGDFAKAFVQVWDLSDGQYARMGRGIAVPIEAFPGVMGTALDEPGGHSTMPPRKNGGNMDVKQLTVGTTLYLPVWVDGALFSVGDGHAAQGDGEVCVTAVEMSARVTLRFDLLRDRRQPEPTLRTRGPLAARDQPGAVLRHHRARPRSLCLGATGHPLHDRPPRPRARAEPRGGLRALQRGRRPQDQRDRRRPELDRLGVSPREHL